MGNDKINKENDKGNGPERSLSEINKLPPLDLRLFSHMKHISEIGEEDQRRAHKILEEIREILEGILWLSSKDASGRLADLKRLKKEIEKLGYALISEIKVSSKRGNPSIKANLYLYTSKCKTRQAN